MKRILHLLSLCCAMLLPSHGYAQPLSLEQCLDEARSNYPAIRQYELVERSCDLTLNNVARAWLPGMRVVGFASAFNDPLEIEPAMQSLLPQTEKSFYGAAVIVNQTVYDGGEIRAQRELARAQADVSSSEIDVAMHQIDERVEDLFFGILMIDEQIGQLMLLTDNLSLSEKTVRGLLEGGITTQSDLDRIKVQQIQAEQQVVNLRTMRRTYSDVLGSFIGRELNEDSVLERPSEMPDSHKVRPEMGLFQARENLLVRRKTLLDSQLIPKVGAFGMASVHNTPLPMMRENYLVGGISMSWNIGSLYTRRNDLLLLESERLQNDVRRETFLFDNRQEHLMTDGQIESIRRQIELDERVVSLREDILEKSNRKVEAGTGTVNEMLADVNAVSEAKQQKAIHEILLLKEIYRNNINVAQ